MNDDLVFIFENEARQNRFLKDGSIDADIFPGHVAQISSGKITHLEGTVNNFDISQIGSGKIGFLEMALDDLSLS